MALKSGLVALVANMDSNIPDVYDAFVKRYGPSVFTQGDLERLRDPVFRAETIQSMASVRIARGLMLLYDGKIKDPEMHEGFVHAHVYADEACQRLVHDVWLAVGRCETHQFLWGRKYSSNFRFIFQRSPAIDVTVP